MSDQEVSAALIDQLSEAQDKTEAAVAAAAQVPNEATAGLVGQVVGQLDTSQQKQDAAVAAAAQVPNEATAGLVAKVVGQLDTSQQKQDAATATMRVLSAADQEAVAAATGVLDRPDVITQRHLWYMVVGTMALAVFAFGVMAFLLLNWKKGAEAPLALSTAALGGIVGLLATSPGRSRR